MIKHRLRNPFARLLPAVMTAMVIGCGGTEPDSGNRLEPEGSDDSVSITSTTPASDPETTPLQMTGRIVTTTAAGRLEIVPERIDFGAVGPGSISRGVFKMTNRGSRPVRVLRVTPSCVCTTLSDLAGSVIGAGETVSLEASLDAPEQAGEKEAKVFVQLEGMDQPAIVKLGGMITLPVQPSPAYASALEGVESGTIRLSATDGRPFRVLASNGVEPDFVGFDSATETPRNTYEIRWSVAGMPPREIPRWWVFTTDHPECPLVACRVRHQETGSRRDPTRFERRWIFPEDFLDLGSVKVGSTVDLSVQLDHYNPRGRGAIDRPEWSESVTVRSLDPRVEATLVSSAVVSTQEIVAMIRVAFNGPDEPLLYAPIQVSTATGSSVLEIIARVDR